MVHQCTRSLLIGSFLKRGITYDANTISNFNLQNKNGAELFPPIVHLKLRIHLTPSQYHWYRADASPFFVYQYHELYKVSELFTRMKESLMYDYSNYTKSW